MHVPAELNNVANVHKAARRAVAPPHEEVREAQHRWHSDRIQGNNDGICNVPRIVTPVRNTKRAQFCPNLEDSDRGGDQRESVGDCEGLTEAATKSAFVVVEAMVKLRLPLR